MAPPDSTTTDSAGARAAAEAGAEVGAGAAGDGAAGDGAAAADTAETVAPTTEDPPGAGTDAGEGGIKIEDGTAEARVQLGEHVIEWVGT